MAVPERRKILAVHTRGVPLAHDVDFDAIAATTPGMVGADLRNLVNEAALEHETLDEADAYRAAGVERGRELLPEEHPAGAPT